MQFNKPIFESDDSADEYPEDNKELEDFKDKEDDEFSDSDKIPLNDLLEKDNGDEELNGLNNNNVDE